MTLKALFPIRSFNVLDCRRVTTNAVVLDNGLAHIRCPYMIRRSDHIRIDVLAPRVRLVSKHFHRIIVG